uniref:Zgc:77752 n=1 Tax=Cyprinus carpio TaxID=7962 RepID=A0A8C1G0P4_CYPCA
NICLGPKMYECKLNDELLNCVPFCLTVYFYNFGMSDFGVSSLEGMLDAVKVLAFAVQEGKVAVHCHAGLGRTGVLIACYLVYTCRISASEAVHYVRIRRPCSIQTRSQISLVFDFARLIRESQQNPKRVLKPR